jgi:hypothetical protein
VQEFRREICPVRPDDRVQLGMKAHRPKCLKLAQRFEDRAIKFVAQVHFTREPVIETESNHVVPNIASFNNLDHRRPPGLLQRFNGL